MSSPAALDLRVISIGALSAHPLWGERAPVRTGHATCTLVRVGKTVILVDPGLPEPALRQRLAERAQLKPEDVTHVFLTSFHPDTHRGIALFDDADWLISREEREGAGVPLVRLLQEAEAREQTELALNLRAEVSILKRCEEAPDALAPDVDLFPLPGVSPGLTGLLVGEPETTTLICGDAVPTIEHLRTRQVMPTCADVAAAQASFAEAIEIADVLVLGRDNAVVNVFGQG